MNIITIDINTTELFYRHVKDYTCTYHFGLLYKLKYLKYFTV